MEHYVYIHYKQDTKEPFYIGKGNKKRYKQTTGRSEYWKRIVNKYGFYSEIHSYYETHEEALIKEIELIKEYKELGFNLCNLSEGGDGITGYKHTNTAKEKISLSFKNKPLSEEHKKKISESKKGIATVVFTQEIKDKLSKALKGKRLTEDNWNYKGKIKATKVSTGEEIILNTTHEAKLMGCSQGTVSLCLNGKRKTHKGFKFEWLNN